MYYAPYVIKTSILKESHIPNYTELLAGEQNFLWILIKNIKDANELQRHLSKLLKKEL